jgi:hypothetical protein
MFHGDRVDMNWRTMEILENHNEIEIFQAKLLLRDAMRGDT